MKIPRNHYDNLKVSRNATDAEIRKAYRGLASIHHPDRNGNSPKSIKAMQCINNAYETLKNPSARATHDAWIAREEAAHRQKSQEQKAQQQQSQHQKPQQQKYQKYTYGEKQKDHSYKKAESNERKSYYQFDDFMQRFREDFEFGHSSWSSSEPLLKTAHRPREFDEKHLEDFTKYNAAIRSKLNGIHLEYVNPELIYRAFLIDKRRGKGAPDSLDKAYKAITRALENKPVGILERLKGFFLTRSPVVQGAIFGTFLCSLLILTTWTVVDALAP